MNRRVTIDNHEIGSGCPPYIVAEMSGNHNQDFSRALAIVDAAKAAGANAVKLQTYLPETITIDHDSDEFIVKGGLWDNRRLFELYKEAHTPWEWHRPIYEHARRIGITVFSSPFDTTAVDFLEELGASKIIGREAVNDESGKALIKQSRVGRSTPLMVMHFQPSSKLVNPAERLQSQGMLFRLSCPSPCFPLSSGG